MWPFTRHNSIDVTFVDAQPGRSIMRSRVPAAQLPDSFELETTVHVAEKPYSVIRAQPIAKEDFRRSGRLQLHVSRITMVDPATILYSLPTIDDR